jgi:[acyl-carrier-protein] S-malonyltransferase
MNCFMFPGQPMALKNIPADDPAFHEMARCCQAVSGFNPITGEQSSRQLTDSIRLQLFGTTMSLYRCDLLLREQGLPAIVAEHSMGVYPALAACGSVDKTTALELTWRVGVCLASMGLQRAYALGCIVGLAVDPLDSIAANNDVHIANYNTSRHFLLAGEQGRIRAAAAEAEAAGAFSVGVIPCDAPLHTPLVDEVAAELHSIVAEYTFWEPRIPLMDHLEQRRLKATDIPGFLVEELCRPVFWEKTFHTLKREGVKHFCEVGAGLALTKFNRWIDSEL